jgi:hypothetical protein
MYSRHNDVHLKNGIKRKIWIRYIEGILMMKQSYTPKNEANVKHPRIKLLTSRFPLNELDLDFSARKFHIKVHKHCKKVHKDSKYHYILLNDKQD